MARKRIAKGTLEPVLTPDGKVVYIKERLLKGIRKSLFRKDVEGFTIRAVRDDDKPLGEVVISYNTKTGKGTFILEGQSL